MATYGYCRVSTWRQANEGESLDVQRRQIEGYVHMHGLTLDGLVVEEGVSGSIPVIERPAGAALFAKLERGDTIISPKLDRLFRSALDALQVVALLDRLYCLAGHPSEGLNFSFQGERLGGKFSVLDGVPIALGSPAGGPMHPADRVAPNGRRSAL
jgi:Resolvase, N terminal domain